MLLGHIAALGEVVGDRNRHGVVINGVHHAYDVERETRVYPSRVLDNQERESAQSIYTWKKLLQRIRESTVRWLLEHMFQSSFVLTYR